MIPEWMKEIEMGACPCCTVSVGKRKNFVQKTISDLFRFFEECLVNDSIAKRDGLLQSLDPRIKLISIVALIFAVAITRDIRLLAIVYVLTLVFAWASRIELGFFLKRVWVFIPIFAGIIMIPILFNVFMPGDALVTIATLGPGAHLGPFALPPVITITWQGVMLALLFVLRVATCVSAAVLLFLTTPGTSSSNPSDHLKCQRSMSLRWTCATGIFSSLPKWSRVFIRQKKAGPSKPCLWSRNRNGWEAASAILS